MKKGYTYILKCADDSYYTGSTKQLLKNRIAQHQEGKGANYTRKRLPIELVYYEEYPNVKEAFEREKQIQGWSRRKKEALIEGRLKDLSLLSRNYTEYGPSTSSGTVPTSSGTVPTSSGTVPTSSGAVSSEKESLKSDRKPSTSSEIVKNMKYKKILVTGAAGFIGHALCKKLIKEEYEVIGLDNINDYYTVDLKYDRLTDVGVSREEAEQWNKLSTSTTAQNFRFIRMNIEDRENLPQLFKEQQFDAVIHLAAQAGVRYSLENPMAYVDSNLVGFVNIMEACRHYQTKHLVYASSSSVYGANDKIPFEEEDRVDYPVSLYAATKKSNELMAHTYSHLYQLKTSGLRFFTVYGPWGRPDMAPMLFANAITKGKPIKVFNHGNMKRDFTYIDDIVNGIIITLNNPPNSKIAKHNQSVEVSVTEPFDSTQEPSVEVPVTEPFDSTQEPPVEVPVTEPFDSTQEPSVEVPVTEPFDSTQEPSVEVPSTNYQLFNIGNGSPVGLMDFIETMEKELKVEAQKNLMEMQPGDVPRTWANTDRLNKLGYKSTTNIQEGVRRFVEWFKQYNKIEG